MLIDLGIEEDVINHWDHRIELGTSSAGGMLFYLLTIDIPTELQYCGMICLWLRGRYAWGRKLLGDGRAAEHIPVKGLKYRPIAPHLGGQRPPCDPFGPYGKYPLAHYYPTAERASQWMEWHALERERLGRDPRPKPLAWLWP